MRKLTTMLLVGICAVMFVTGCAVVQSPLSGVIYTNVDAPMDATSNDAATKMGTASATSILGIIATGDASIETAAKSAGITKIHHVDYQARSILGIFARYTVKVYGN
ncbi:hypothetical protein HQ590_01730 [bacterium]|nr:hypothetical protein [bacterium]